MEKKPAKYKRVLFVCTGNTCRSPMAESIFKARVKEKNLAGLRCSSAGIYAEAGAPMPLNAKKALKTLKIRPAPTKAKPVTPALMKRANLVLCMTMAHKSALISYGHKNLFTLAEFVKSDEIPDPYGGGEDVYIETAKTLCAAVDSLLEILN